MIIIVFTLFSLLQLRKRYKLLVVQKRKVTLFSWGNNDQTEGMSANIQRTHVVSMTFTHFLEIFLQYCCCFIATGLIGQSMQTLK